MMADLIKEKDNDDPSTRSKEGASMVALNKSRESTNMTTLIKGRYKNSRCNKGRQNNGRFNKGKAQQRLLST
jgi:hypothetical protein